MVETRVDSPTSTDRLSSDSLEHVASRLAESHVITPRPRHRASLLNRLQGQEMLLRNAHRYFAIASDVELALSYVAEWVLDNFYVVERTLRQIREDMPEGYYRQLPKLETTPLEGYPRVYAVAREIIARCNGHLDLDRITRFVQVYQRVTSLTMGELWALPTMLRLGIVEALTRAVFRITQQRQGEGRDGLPRVLAESLPIPLSEDLEDETLVGNCILSLRMLETQDWKVFFESVSRVDLVLRWDPADVYVDMDFDTRDRYRGVIEELALRTGQDEVEVTWEAIRLAQEEAARAKDEDGSGVPRTAHVGFYLLDAGRRQLEARLGYRPSMRVRLARWLLDSPTATYLGGITLFTAFVVLALVYYALVAGGTPIQLAAAGLLTLLPATAIAVSLVNWLVTHVVPPRLLPRLDFQDGIPAECCTMVVIPAILSSAEETQSLLQQLEIHYLGNPDPHLHFALSADFGDAPQKHMAGDDELLDQIGAGVQALNKKYGRAAITPFYFLYREREWNPMEDCWMGWERKRGKLVELNRLLGGQETSYSVQVGDLDVLSRVRYVITLDADTVLPIGAARRLVATLAHVLNRAEFDPEGGAVVAGYTVLQPRVEIKPAAAGRSLFARIFSGDIGLDLYTRAVSDVYQDLFGEGIYAGKGIYDVKAFERSLAGRVPENALLSHDLFEGIHGRVGLVTDVIMYEDYPSHYLAYTRRLHRWVRGDWQLLPWLLPKVPAADGGKRPNDLSLIDRWKILDNLRRSLLTPMLLALLLAGWIWLPGTGLLWTLVGVLSLTVNILTGAVTKLPAAMRGASLAGVMHAVWMDVLRWLLLLVFLPYETLILVDAIVSTLARMFITRKRLLQWTTAAHTVQLFGRRARVGLLWRHMGAAPIMALEFIALVLLVYKAAFPVATPLLFVWLISPYIAYWISQPVTREQVPLTADQCQRLRRLARQTWHYFEQFVGPDDQWLPPDHFQEDPLGLVAHRTSPTNVGLLLLSTLAAYDLGYTGPLDLVLRLRPTFETMERMERYRGHFLNWYDTRNLRPLPPRYVSTVDSGNLAACLLVLRQGCLSLPHAPVLRWQRWQGLLDTLGVLAETVEEVRHFGGADGEVELKAAAVALQGHLQDVCQQVLAAQDKPNDWALLLVSLSETCWPELERLLISLVESGSHVLEAATLSALRVWSERVCYQLLSMRSEVDMLLPWLLRLSQVPALFALPQTNEAIVDTWQALLNALSTTPRLDEVGDVCSAGRMQLEELQRLLADEAGLPDEVQEARNWCMRLGDELYSARMAAESLQIGLQDLAAQAEAYFQLMEFDFLFDSHRQVFHIGFNVEAGALDDNRYDLLASEARIASLLAITKGDVPSSHWLHLARPITRVNGSRALLSWGGTLFEYLMPPLLMQSYEGTLLEQSSHVAVARQIAYGNQRGVPWGVSESGFYQFDAGQHYQYRGFGVPGLGLKRGLGEDVVVAPYASLLALSLRPLVVVQNIERLVKLGLLGQYGFYEAIDYTRSRLSPDQKSGIVRSYMVHHQGMILLALTNYLHDETMVHRFHADPRVQSVELLLHEQVPHAAPVEMPHSEEVHAARPAQARAASMPWSVRVNTPIPQVHVLSNGRYSVVITNAGGGYSSWKEVDLSRWRPDTTLDDWGTWVYVKDRDSGALWSAGYRPTCVASPNQDVLFQAHQARIWRRDDEICVRTDITVAPEHDVEIRAITLTNHGGRRRRLALTSHGEIVLAPQATDRRHPAFNKLFIESEHLPELNGLLFRRRPRSAEEEPVYMIHMLVADTESEVLAAYESDRGRFLGRGRTLRSPAALDESGQGLSGTVGATLDPIMALGWEVELKPHAKAEIAYVTVAAGSRHEVLALAHRYRSWPRIWRTFDRARSQSEVELRQLGLTVSDVKDYQRLLSVLLYPHAALRATPATLAANHKGQSGLWAYAISGDYPILLVRVSEQEELDLVRELLQAHTYWRNRQIRIDLVISNERETGYDQELHGQLHRLVARMDGDAWLNQRGGIFVLRADQMDEATRVLLGTAARAILDGKKGRLSEQLRRLRAQPARLPYFVPALPSSEDVEPTPPVARPADLLFDNGLAGFSADGREYVIYLEPGQWAPAPWINVIANPGFGFLVSEAGSGYTWVGNSGENRLTPWHNDPLSNPPGEVLYLRDEETARVWSPTPLPAGELAAYLVRHGAGYSVFEHNSHGLKQRLRLFAVPDAPLKVVQLRLENVWRRARRITATFYVEWVLGTDRDLTQPYIVPEFDVGSNALLARNTYSEEFGERVAFVAASEELHGVTADRSEFLGREGGLSHPVALNRIGLAGTVRAGLDPCAALQVHLDLAPGEMREIFFLLGQGEDWQDALRLVKQYRDAAQVEVAWQGVTESWDRLLGTVTVRTPDSAMDLLLNRWLLYQALSCRVWGRSALYQSSGAFGYRDQLQDVMALLYTAPDLVREHILRAARYQFEEGDVLHWWHPPSGRGVRTRCSDDLLWLPFVAAHYVAATGDDSILDETVPFLQGAPLEPDEMERYGHFESAAEAYPLYEHCRRAVEKGTTAGAHDLPLIGSHDWNDGLSRVGIEGQGESVWLGWFLYATLIHFAPLCERTGDVEQAAEYRQRARNLRRALEDSAWDRAWYRRAYYDDGTPLGSSESEEAQIDSIAQSWAVLSGAADPARAAQAMESVERRLVRYDDQLILLFTPPFNRTRRNPGYIKGYPPGVRENGGQYTHAALWAVWAFAELGQGDRAEALFRLLNPIYHSDTPDKVARYRVEPYVVAADVYSVEPYVGRGGWTWYTGSAGWMYRLGVEAILGLRRVGDVLRIDPCIPRDWPGYELTYRHGETSYRIRVGNPDGVNRGVRVVTLDGEVLPGEEIPLLDDGQQHEVEVLMAGRRYL
jgi:cyclic beta-1,2-glucan synthetase